jgi:4-amino-4-deoxy-L-arabinose transferase-like glycosyltransferase
MLGNYSITKVLREYYPLLVILVGVMLISIPIGPFRTLDTGLELSTAQGVMRWGYPFYKDWGNLFNEPPLGFYIEALFFRVFSATEENGIWLITLFGLGCTVMVYKLGKEFYGKSTALFAAAFFALAPWELILTRAFLIDTQCLFLSMIYLYFGILAIRKDSVKLAAVSGIFFAAALLTKLFAVFMLIPLLLLYIYRRPRNTKQIVGQLGAFILPAIFSVLVWYQLITGKGILYLFQHNDFKDLNFPEVIPSYSFVTNFLTNYGLGLVFFVAVVFSFAVGLVFWKRFSKQSIASDIICLVTILCILGLVVYLAVNLNLKAPYTSVIKYIYQSLPFFSLAAGSLASKSISLLKSARQSAKVRRALLFSISFVGLLLLVATIIVNMNAARELATSWYLIFRVQPNQDVGYSFYVQSPLSQSNSLLTVQFFGVVAILSALLWASRRFIVELFRPLRQWIRLVFTG